MPEEVSRSSEEPQLVKLREEADDALHAYIPEGSNFNDASLRMTILVTAALRGLYLNIRQSHGPAEAAAGVGAPLRTFTAAMEAEVGDKLKLSIGLTEEPDAQD